MYVDGSGTYFYTGNYTTKTLSGTGATAVSYDAQGNYYIGETTLCEISGVVAHGSSGEASVSITAGWESTPWGIYGSLSGTATLPTIARASQPSCITWPQTTQNVGDIGSTFTIHMNRKGAFTHYVYCKWGSKTVEIGKNVADNVSWTIPIDFTDDIPNSQTGTGTIYVDTYNGTSKIGTQSVSFTASVPAYNPTISNISLTGNNLLSGTYVQGKSTVKVDITASSLYGATIKSYSSTVDEKTYSGATFTSDALSSGSKTIKTTITDTRGKTATLTSSAFTVYDYSPPQITEFTLERQPDGTTVIATVKGSIAAVNNKNTKTIKVTLDGVTNTITSSTYTINATTTFTKVDTDTTFIATASFADYYTTDNPITKDSVLPTVAVTMDFWRDGNGIAMGKVAEQGNLLDVAWDIKTSGNLNVSKNANVTGNASVGGDLTVGGKNLLDYANAKHSWGKNTALYNSQTVANAYGNTLTGASITLAANSTYLVLVGVMASDGSQTTYSDILLAGVETGGETLISCSGRGGAYAGGGTTGFAIVKTTSSTFARCQSYGYKNAKFDLYMRTIAIKLDT